MSIAMGSLDCRTGRRHALVEAVLAGGDPDSLAIFHVHGDHLGRGHVLTSASGDLLSQEEFLAYGRASDRRDARNRHRYIGVERDEDTGLCITGPRTYMPGIGRFLQGDPLAAKFAAWAPFAYALARPIAALDATGKSPAAPLVLPAMFTDYARIVEVKETLDRNLAPSEFMDAALTRYWVYSFSGATGRTQDPSFVKPPVMLMGRDAPLETVVHEAAHAFMFTSPEAREMTRSVATRLVGARLSGGGQVNEDRSLRAAQEAMASYVSARVSSYAIRSAQAFRVEQEFLSGELTRSGAIEELAVQASLFQDEQTNYSYGAFQESGRSALAGEGREVALLDPLPSDVRRWLDDNVVGASYSSFYDPPAVQRVMDTIGGPPPVSE